MTKLSLAKKLCGLFLFAGLLTTSFAQDAAAADAEDKSVDEIKQTVQVERTRLYHEAKSQYELGKAAYIEQNYADAVDKFVAADITLKLVSRSNAEILELQEEVKLLLQKSYIAYADQLIEEADKIRKISKFADAKDLLDKALQLNKELQPVVDLMLEKIKVGEDKVRFENATDPANVDPERPEREFTVAVNVSKGKTFLQHRQYVRARDSFERALIKDPGNEEAIHYLKIIYTRLYDIAGKRRQAMKLERVAEIEWKWIDHIPPLDEDPLSGNADTTTVENTLVGKQAILEKLQNIVIPRIKFEDANIETVIQFLSERSKSIDVTGKGVNIIYIKPKTNAGAGAAAPDAGDAGLDDFEIDAGGAAPAAGGNKPKTSLISMEIDDIPLGDAIHYVCTQAGLQYIVEEHAIVISDENFTPQELETRFYAVEPNIFIKGAGGGGDEVLLDEPGADAGNDYQGFFEKFGVRFPTTPSGETASISFDPRTSKLIVTNTAEELRKIERILKELNIQTPQVTIEAKFVEVRQENLDELTFNWRYNGTTRDSNNIIGDGEGESQSNSFNSEKTFWNPDATDVSSLSTGVRSLANVLSTDSTVSALLSIDSIIQGNMFNTLIYAFSQQQGNDFLSAPKVTVQSGVEAYIAMSEERRFPESYDAGDLSFGGGGFGGGNAQPVLQQTTPEFGEARDDIGITLTVTPTVAPDGLSITLELTPKVIAYLGLDTDFNQTQVVPGGAGDEPTEVTVNFGTPIFEVREVRTIVTVWDGETVILGGTIKDEITKIEDKIPFIGDLPLIGRLFRSTGENTSKRNLLIFVSARIIDPAGQPIRDINVRGKPDFRR